MFLSVLRLLSPGLVAVLPEEMLRYNPNVRISAEDALLDDFFLTQPFPERPSALAQFLNG